MAPITCLTDIDSDNIYNRTTCHFQLKDNNYAVPILNHMGYSFTYPSYCDCGGKYCNYVYMSIHPIYIISFIHLLYICIYLYLYIDGTGPGATEDNCNVFNLLAGLLIYNKVNGTNDYDVDNPLMDLINQVPITEMNKNAYTAMYASAALAYTDSYQTNTTFREDAYAFCKVSNQNCTILSINVMDYTNRAVNSYFYNVDMGSCKPSIVMPSQYFDNIMNNPPQQLEENYYTCKPSVLSAFSDAVGIAVGNMSALAPIVLIFVINVYLFGMKSSKAKNDVKQTYAKAERDDALQGLALQLLMMRDNRIKRTPVTDSSGSDCHSHDDIDVLKLLTNKLDPYFKVEDNKDRHTTSASSRSVSTASRSTVGNPMMQHSEALNAIELGTVTAVATAIPNVVRHLPEEQVTILNSHMLPPSTFELFVQNAALVKPLLKSHFSQPDPLSCHLPATVITSVEELISVVGVINAQMVKYIESDGVDSRDFTEIAVLTSVFKHSFNIELLHHYCNETTSAITRGKSDPRNIFRSIFSNLISALYQLIQLHIRIEYKCSEDDMFAKYGNAIGYEIGSSVRDKRKKNKSVYTIRDLDCIYNECV